MRSDCTCGHFKFGTTLETYLETHGRIGLWPCYISQSEINVNKTLQIRYMLYFGLADKKYKCNAYYN